MQFIWYGALPLLLLIPFFVFGYWWILRRRSRYAVRYPSLVVVNQIANTPTRLRRHLPPVVFLIAVSSMLLAFTRPYTVTPNGQNAKIAILTIDVSASMMRSDIKPNRLEAAKAAAHDFVNRQQPDVQIGVVAFSESASLVQAPTANREAILRSIDRLQIDSSTAIGRGILTSLSAIAGGSYSETMSHVMPLQAMNSLAAADAQWPGVVVLLTDGQNVVGPSPIDAAYEAIRHGVRIYTVGIGSSTAVVTPGPPDQLDEKTLTQIADITGAKYFRAFDETALSEIYSNLMLQFSVKEEKAEMAPGLTAIAFLLVLVGTTLSYTWNAGMP